MANVRSGGGPDSRNVSHRYEPKVNPVANKASPAGANQLGQAVQFRKEELIQQGKGYNPVGVPATGVPGKFNAAAQGPGSGRTVYPSGSQTQYGPPATNAVNRTPDVPATTPGRDILRDYGKDYRSK